MTRLSPAQARTLTLGPDSVSWSHVSDVRGFLGAGYALLLQVMHPTVSSGVRDHSNFQAEPWQRLFRTLDYVNLTVYSGHDAIEVTARLREMHKHIKGTDPDGTRYHALEPRAFAWVQATLVHAVVTSHEWFGRPLSPDDAARLYREWHGLGRLLGVRAGDLPADWAGFQAYFDHMVATELRRTETSDVVLASLARPARPPFLPAWTQPLWRVAWWPAGHVLSLCALGVLPPVLRERLGVRWTGWQARELRAIGRFSRALTPIMPVALQVSGPQYLRARAAAIGREEFAPRPNGLVSGPWVAT